MNIFQKILIIIVKAYKLIISPIIHLLPNSGCRFYPTCSNYMILAIQRHGAFKGSIMGMARILRCNPLCSGGIDKVPEIFSWKRIFCKNSVDEQK